MRLRFSFLPSIFVAAAFAPATARSETPPDPAPVRGAPEVHVEATSPDVILFRVPSPEERKQLGADDRRYGVPICRVPCDDIIDGREGQTFLFGGKDVTPSEEFMLAHRRRVWFEVDAGSREKHRYGTVMTSVGGGVAGFGLLVVVPTSMLFGRANAYTIGGSVVGTAGLALFISGISLLARNKTSVEVKRSATFDRGVLRF
jgi:hypothetical protein